MFDKDRTLKNLPANLVRKIKVSKLEIRWDRQWYGHIGIKCY